MASGEREVRTGVVIKRGRDPSLDVVALCTTGLAGFRELGPMRINMAILADLRSSLKLHLARTRRGFVAGATCHRPMGAKEGKFGFRMVETEYIRP